LRFAAWPSYDKARRTLNRAFFKRVFLDHHGKVARSELAELFTDLQRTDTIGPAANDQAAVTNKAQDVAVLGLDSETAALHLRPKVKGWNKADLVAGTGLESVTSGL
jgi:hypothetical protein